MRLAAGCGGRSCGARSSRPPALSAKALRPGKEGTSWRKVSLGYALEGCAREGKEASLGYALEGKVASLAYVLKGKAWVLGSLGEAEGKVLW